MSSAVSTSDFRTLDDSGNLAEGAVNPYYLEDLKRRIAVARVDGAIHAFDDIRPETHCPLSSGLLTGTRIMSQCDGSTFDIETGAIVRGPATLPLTTHEARERDGRIEVRV